jgi:hypothetical protein
VGVSLPPSQGDIIDSVTGHLVGVAVNPAPALTPDSPCACVSFETPKAYTTINKKYIFMEKSFSQFSI